jgi:hypothetical protein
MNNEEPILKRAGRHRSPGSFTYDLRVGAIDDYCVASEANDIGGLVKTLSPDVELISPLSGRLLFRGRDDLGVLLGAIYGTLKDLRWSTQLNDGSTGFVIGHARAGPFRIDDAMVFELSRDGFIMRIRPHLRPWLATTAFALLLGPKIARHPRVVWRAIRHG